MNTDEKTRASFTRGWLGALKPAFLIIAISLLLLVSCGAPQGQPSAPVATPEADSATLSSLQLVDDYPLYTMRYVGSYEARAALPRLLPSVTALHFPAGGVCQAPWGCSLFAALGDQDDRLLGRNFDWEFSPALLLFTYPEAGYASVSMVDISYLGFGGDRSRGLQSLSLDQRQPLLDAPLLPFDGMNERGLAVGMAAVEPGNMPRDPQKRTVGELRAIRELLDHAATVDEAINLLGSFNIDMEEVPIHYLVASASGESALVEFYEGQMRVFRNEARWQTATNFLVASTNGDPQGQCWRYDRMSQELEAHEGRLSGPDAVNLLGNVSQDNTQWSIVYHITTGRVDVVMGRNYSGPTRTFQLEDSEQ